jgi:hypothetical protein
METLMLKDSLFVSGNINIQTPNGNVTGNVQMTSPGSICSKTNKTPRQIAKLSRAAASVERLYNKKVAVAKCKGLSLTYVELTHSDGSIEAALVDLKDAEKVISLTAPKSVNGLSAISFVIAALYGNDEFCDSISSFGSETKIAVDEIKAIFGNLQNITLDNLFILCDAFYYGIAKTIEVEVNDNQILFDSTVNRLLQSGSLEHVDDTAEVKNFNLKKKATRQTKKKDSLPDMPLDEFTQKYRSGYFFWPYDGWNDFQKSKIPEISDDFIITEMFKKGFIALYAKGMLVLNRIKKGISPYDAIKRSPLNVLLAGIPGTGKTQYIKAICAGLHIPLGIEECTFGMEEDDVQGKACFQDGYITTRPTTFTLFHGIGGGICMEEGNLPNPAILQGTLGDAIWDPFILKVDGHKEVIRHPLTVYFLTMNPDAAGTHELNHAFLSRYTTAFFFNEKTMSKEDMLNILVATGSKKKDCLAVYKVYEKIHEYLKKYNEDLKQCISLRQCISCLELMECDFSLADSVEMSFTNLIMAMDEKIGENLMQTLQIIL